MSSRHRNSSLSFFARAQRSYPQIGIAELLLSTHGGLRGVAALTIEEMSQVNGLGPAKGAQIKAAIEFGRRLVASSPEERPRIRSPRDVYNLIGPTLRDEKREHFMALLLDTKGGVMKQRTISIGDLSSSLVHPRKFSSRRFDFPPPP